MHQKALILLEAGLGALAVLGLLLVGADAVRHALRGSDRKRRVLEAGLAALALLGIWPASLFGEEKAPSGTRPPLPLPSGQIDREDRELAQALSPILEARPAWRELLALRRSLRAALAVDRDRGPEGLRDEEALRDRLGRAARLIDALEAEGGLERGAAEFLRRDAHELSRIAQRLAAPPEGEAGAERRGPPVEENVRFLAETTPLLERIATGPGPRPQVAEEILASLAPRIAFLAEARIEFGLTVERRNEARALRASLREIAEALRAPERAPLGRDARWARFLGIWERAERLRAGRDPWPGAKAGWEALDASLEEGPRLLDALVAAGTLGKAEAEALLEEFDPAARTVAARVRDERTRGRTGGGRMIGPPRPGIPAFDGGAGRDPAGSRGGREGEGGRRIEVTPCPGPTCYTPSAVPSWPEADLGILRARLGLLERLAAQDRVRPEVLERVLGTVEAHLEAVARSAAHRDGPEATRAKALLAKIKAK